jgi:hypothetical protein
MTGLRALTVRPPWSWALLHGKDVENRSWGPPPWLREFALHAGSRSRWDPDGEDSPLVRRAWHDYWAPLGDVPPLNRRTEHVTFGAITALATLGDRTHDARGTRGCACSRWAAADSWHWMPERITALAEPIPCAGHLGLWPVTGEAENAVRAAAREAAD